MKSQFRNVFLPSTIPQILQMKTVSTYSLRSNYFKELLALTPASHESILSFPRSFRQWKKWRIEWRMHTRFHKIRASTLSEWRTPSEKDRRTEGKSYREFCLRLKTLFIARGFVCPYTIVYSCINLLKNDERNGTFAVAIIIWSLEGVGKE